MKRIFFLSLIAVCCFTLCKADTIYFKNGVKIQGKAVVKGAKVGIVVPKSQIAHIDYSQKVAIQDGACEHCSGLGHIYNACTNCNGTGWVDCKTCKGTGKMPTQNLSGARGGETCSDCSRYYVRRFRKDATQEFRQSHTTTPGKVPCSTCNGTGKILADCPYCVNGRKSR